MLVTFSGVDNSGKTTQISCFSKMLSKHKCRHICVWARGGYTPGIELFKRVLRAVLPKTVPRKANVAQRNKAFSKKKIRQIWLIVAIIDLMIIWGVYVRWALMRGNIVICDRYIDDTLVDFIEDFPSDDVGEWMLWKILRSVIPKPNISFLLIVPIEEQARRSVQKGEEFPDSEGTRFNRMERYCDEGFFPDTLYLRIDGLRPLDDIAELIWHQTRLIRNETI